jgi:hypothetical protein
VRQRGWRISIRRFVGNNVDLLSRRLLGRKNGFDGRTVLESDGSSLFDSTQTEDPILHLTKCFWLPVLEVSEGLPNPKSSVRRKRRKTTEPVEPILAAEVMER